MPTLATFNANNFFLRYRFSRTYPGDRSRASLIEANEVAGTGFLPQKAASVYGSRYIIWDSIRRDLAYYSLLEPDNRLPDILCFQEVENIQAIRKLNEAYFGTHYPYSHLIDGYDVRNIDVGVLSVFPIVRARSHIDDTDNTGSRIFSRDCLEVTVEIPNIGELTVFVNHFKSKYVPRRARETNANYNARVLASHRRREAQAAAVEGIVRERFAGQLATGLYAVVGDFNDTPLSPWVRPIVNSNILTDIVARHRLPNDRWTYYYRSRNRVSQIDYVLGSRAFRDRVDVQVAANANRVPHIERSGLAFREISNVSGEILPSQTNLIEFEDDGVTPLPAGGVPAAVSIPFQFARWENIFDDWRNNISDHCPVKVWF